MTCEETYACVSGSIAMDDGFRSPISIYCLTGTGRSATVIALDICFRKLDDTAKRTCGPLLDVQDVVLRLRTRRAMAIQVNINNTLGKIVGKTKETNICPHRTEQDRRTVTRMT